VTDIYLQLLRVVCLLNAVSHRNRSTVCLSQIIRLFLLIKLSLKLSLYNMSYVMK